MYIETKDLITLTCIYKGESYFHIYREKNVKRNFIK